MNFDLAESSSFAAEAHQRRIYWDILRLGQKAIDILARLQLDALAGTDFTLVCRRLDQRGEAVQWSYGITLGNSDGGRASAGEPNLSMNTALETSLMST